MDPRDDRATDPEMEGIPTDYDQLEVSEWGLDWSDVSQIRNKLKLTPTERLKAAQDFIKQVIGKPSIDPPFDKLPPDAQRARLWAAVQAKLFAQGDDYLAEISAKAYAEAQSNAHPLGDIPLIVLARSRSDYPANVVALLTAEHTAQQATLATLSTTGTEIIVPNSGHHIQLDTPDAVVDAIRSLVLRVRR